MAFAFRSSLSVAHGFSFPRLRRVRFLCNSTVDKTLHLSSFDEQKFVLEVKEKLQREHPMLPLGRYGRDDDEMILWFLKDRKFRVEDTIPKITKAIKWRKEFGVSDLSEDDVSDIAKTGKAYVHEHPDVYGRPVLVVAASKHFPAKHDPLESEKLCVFLIEKAISTLPAGEGDILGIFDLRGFGPENADILFLKFVIDVFYYYYPKRLGQVLFVDAPVIFQPIWQLVKPLLRSYANLVLLSRHCPEGILYRSNNAYELQRLSRCHWCHLLAAPSEQEALLLKQYCMQMIQSLVSTDAGSVVEKRDDYLGRDRSATIIPLHQ